MDIFVSSSNPNYRQSFQLIIALAVKVSRGGSREGGPFAAHIAVRGCNSLKSFNKIHAAN